MKLPKEAEPGGHIRPAADRRLAAVPRPYCKIWGPDCLDPSEALRPKPRMPNPEIQIQSPGSQWPSLGPQANFCCSLSCFHAGPGLLQPRKDLGANFIRGAHYPQELRGFGLGVCRSGVALSSLTRQAMEEPGFCKHLCTGGRLVPPCSSWPFHCHPFHCSFHVSALVSVLPWGRGPAFLGPLRRAGLAGLGGRRCLEEVFPAAPLAAPPQNSVLLPNCVNPSLTNQSATHLNPAAQAQAQQS